MSKGGGTQCDTHCNSFLYFGEVDNFLYQFKKIKSSFVKFFQNLKFPTREKKTHSWKKSEKKCPWKFWSLREKLGKSVRERDFSIRQLCKIREQMALTGSFDFHSKKNTCHDRSLLALTFLPVINCHHLKHREKMRRAKPGPRSARTVTDSIPIMHNLSRPIPVPHCSDIPVPVLSTQLITPIFISKPFTFRIRT